MSSSTECLRCTDITMSYGRKKILSSCSLRVAPGELVGLIGENGSGKTTLLKGILGFLPIDSGWVSIKAPVGFCPQEDILNGNLTVSEHFQFFGSILKHAPAPEAGYRESLLQQTGLIKFLDTVISKLSGGTYQKVKLITAMWGQPRFLVLDEPCDGFDWQMYALFWQLVATLAQAGTGVLMISHFLHDRERFHRVYEIADGGVADVT